MDKQTQIKQILRRAAGIEQGGEIALAREFINIDEKIDNIEEKIDSKLADLSEGLKKKLDEELVYEVDEEKIVESVLSKVVIPKPKDGEDYVLTEKDKKDIASSIKVPIAEKVIEKTEVIHETPIITNEIKEVAVTDTGEQIVEKINDLPITPENQIDASHIKNLPEYKGKAFIGGVSGIKEIISGGSNVHIDNTNLGYPKITVDDTNSFETVSKNLKAYPYTFNKTGDVLDSIVYDLGDGLEITKTFNRTGEVLDTVVLSGDTPTGIDLTKTFNRVGGVLTSITYS